MEKRRVEKGRVETGEMENVIPVNQNKHKSRTSIKFSLRSD